MTEQIRHGTIVGSEIIENMDGEEPVRMLDCEIDSADDVQSIELFGQNGEQTNPLDDANVVIIELSSTWKIAVAVNDQVAPDSGLARGEKKIYALNSAGHIAASILLKGDGTCEVGAGDQFVALAGKVIDQVSQMLQAGVGAGGPGAANFTAAKLWWDTTPGAVVASTNLKADD